MSKNARQPIARRRSPGQGRDKRAKFVELATNRVNRTLKDLALIGNLANRRNYDYDDEQAKKIVKALQVGVDEVKARFTSKGAGNHSPFEL
jgi:hypothetical protein